MKMPTSSYENLTDQQPSEESSYDNKEHRLLNRLIQKRVQVSKPLLTRQPEKKKFNLDEV